MRIPGAIGRAAALVLLVLCLALPTLVRAQTLPQFLAEVAPATCSRRRQRSVRPEGGPPLVPVLDAGGERLGWAYLNTDFTTSIGYSGKPIRILVGIDDATAPRARAPSSSSTTSRSS